MIGEDNEILLVRKLCKLLVREVSQEERMYVEAVLGMSFEKALEEEPITLFLLLLECYVKYVQYVVMLRDIDEVFKDFGVKPALSYGMKTFTLPEYIDKYVPSEHVKLYEELFASPWGEEMLRNFISMVKNEGLRKRFQRFFLAHEFPYE